MFTFYMTMSEHNQLSYWRDAASLIMIGKLPQGGTAQGGVVQGDSFGVLMVERNKKSSFFPGVFVFPGGTVSDVDYAQEWNALFEKVVSMTTDDVTRELQVPGPRPPVMSPKAGNSVGHQRLHPCIAFRICAIRETFEESGILLATRKVNDRNILTGSSSVFTCENVGEDFEVWREKVHKDPWSFLDMCIHLSLVPDVWALREWSNWLTPVDQQVEGPSPKPYRFDTMFYACCLDHMPRAVHDAKEVTDAKWVLPRQATGQMVHHVHVKGKYRGPQGYELPRLANFSLIDELFRYIRQREPLGLEVFFPVFIRCKDGFIVTMPGDGLYPQNLDKYGMKKLEDRDSKTIEELRKESRFLHRTEHFSDGDSRFVCNFKLNCGQVVPVRHEIISML